MSTYDDYAPRRWGDYDYVFITADGSLFLACGVNCCRPLHLSAAQDRLTSGQYVAALCPVVIICTHLRRKIKLMVKLAYVYI